MSQPPPPPPGQPPVGGFGPPEPLPGGGEPTLGAGVPVPPTPPPAPGTPPVAPPVVPGGQPGQPGYGYPQAPPPPAAQGPYASPYQPAPGPPGQPAQGGGFGAPTYGAGFGTPTQGGFTAPTQGGGFTAPTQGGGFGVPTAPGPAGAPSVGFPAVPPPGQGGHGGQGGGRRRGNQRLYIALAVAFALLAGGGGGYVLLSGDDGGTTAGDASGDSGGGGGETDGGESGGGEGEGGGAEGLPEEAVQSTLAWDKPSPEVPDDRGVIDARASWLLDDALVRLVPEGLVSYDLASGEEQWSLPFELSEGRCQASANVSENRVALLQGRDCEALTVVDIAAGQEVATIPIESAWPTSTNSVPAILGDTVVVGTGVAGIGFSISEQAKKWESSANDRCTEAQFMVVGETIISQMLCGWLGDEGGSIRATDEGGQELWSWEYEGTYEDQEFQVESVISAEPLVVMARSGDVFADDGSTRILVIDETHQEIQTELAWDEERQMQPCEVTVFDDCWPAQVLDGFLYLPTNEVYGDNSVVAFDLSTGQPLYEVPAINGGQIWPFASQDGQILAYQPASDTLEGMVVAIDPATEQARPVMALDREARPQEYALVSGLSTHDQIPRWSDNTFVLCNRKFYASEGSEVPSVLVYR